MCIRDRVERPAITQATGKETEPKLVEQPSPAKTAEPWEVTVGGPGWLAGLTGHLGGHGVTVPVDIGVRQIIINSNVLNAAAAEVRKGRFGVLGGYVYINAQASSPTKGLVSKVDVGLQQYISNLAAGWRLIEGSRGWLDLLGGFRFFYIGNQSSLQANEQAIDQASTRLVDLFGEQLATPNSNLRNLIQQQLDLRALNGRSPPLPVPPLADREPDKIRNAISDLIQAQQPELAAAIRTGAQARINQLKSCLLYTSPSPRDLSTSRMPSSA